MRRIKELLDQLARTVTRNRDVQILITDHIDHDHGLDQLRAARIINLLCEMATTVQPVVRTVLCAAFFTIKKRNQKFRFQRPAFFQHPRQFHQYTGTGT